MEPENASSDFGTPHRSTYSRPPQGRSGWCGSCGLRRGADGRCSNCDAWWTSPLVQYGAPLLIATTFLLLMGVSLLRPKSSFIIGSKPPIPVPASRAYSIPVPSPAFPGGNFAPSQAASGGLGYVTPPISAPASAPLQTAALSQNDMLWQSQQELNDLTQSVNAAWQADQTARLQAERSSASQAYGGRSNALAPVQAEAARLQVQSNAL